MEGVFEGAQASHSSPPEAIKIRMLPRTIFRLLDKYKNF